MVPTPTQTWRWFEGESIQDCMDRCRLEYAKNYGPGGLYATDPHDWLLGQDRTLENVGMLCRFFLAACVWMQGRLACRTGVIERHHRKRLEKEHKRDLKGGVKIVELRRREASRRESDQPGESRPVNWSCQWMVIPHWRNQRVGPGRNDRRLVHIDTYVKGPDDKPLKAPKATVYRVAR
jgi:hypothetical protein